jgi:hypothetical protein
VHIERGYQLDGVAGDVNELVDRDGGGAVAEETLDATTG